MIRNAYKRRDVFACRHEVHRGFAHQVSAYHVLHEKQCYPDGCIEFVWKCKLLDKGGTCPKRYRHVGNNCTQCRHYDEEKRHRYPEPLLSAEDYRAFEDECRRFDEWLEDHEGRLLDAGGQITAIRPHLIRCREERRTGLILRGYLLRLQPAYIGRDGLADALYLRLSAAQQRRHRLAAGDEVEAQGIVRRDRGRLVVGGTRRLRVEGRSGGAPARWDRALLDRRGAVPLEGQPARCIQCERGVLVDVEHDRRAPGRARREMLCLEGIGRPAECPFEALRAMGAAGGVSPSPLPPSDR